MEELEDPCPPLQLVSFSLSDVFENESFKFIENTIPLYIPLEHHKMSVLDFEKSYDACWRRAAYFLICNKGHGFPMWKKLEEQIKAMDETNLCRPYYSKELLDTLTSDLFHEGEKDFPGIRRNFLLEPWVQVQLPFQPVLLHQWVAEVTSQLLSFEWTMSQFYIFPVPAKIMPKVEALHEMLKSTQQSVGFLFDYLQVQIKTDTDIYIGNIKLLSENLSKVLEFLEFWTPSNGIQYILTLRSYLVRNVGEDADDNNKRLEKGSMPLSERNFIYNPAFWRQTGSHLTLFGDSREKLVGEKLFRSKVSSDENSKGFKYNLYNLKEKLEIQIYDDLIDFNYLQNLKANASIEGALKELNKAFDSVLDIHTELGVFYPHMFKQSLIELYSSKLKLIHMLKQDAKNVRNIPAEDRGVEESPMTFDFSEPFDLLKTAIKIRKEVEGSLRDEESHIWQKFIMEKHKSSEEFFSQACDRLSSNEAELPNKIAMIFQSRIKKIVIDSICYHMGINESNSEGKHKVVLRDWQVVQYLLPCFVAFFLDIYRLEPNQETDMKKERYLRFVHELIKTYETDGISKSAAFHQEDAKNNIRKYWQAWPLGDSSDLLFFMKNLQCMCYPDIFPLDGSSTLGFFSPFLEALQNSETMHPNNELTTSTCLYWNWLLWDFYNRFYLALGRSYPVPSAYVQCISIYGVEISNFIRTMLVQDNVVFDNVLIFFYDKMNESEKTACLERLKEIKQSETNLNLAEEIINEMKSLTEHQTWSIAFYMAMRLFEKPSAKPENETKQEASDKKAYSSNVENTDQNAIKAFYHFYFYDSMKASFEFAKEIAPASYSFALTQVVGDREIKMTEEYNWCFPIKHCRLCGNLRAQDMIEDDNESLFCSANCLPGNQNTQS